MKLPLLEVLSVEELRQIDAASLQILAEVGIKVDYPVAREIYRRAGAVVDDAAQMVRLSETLVRSALAQAPASFRLYGSDGSLSVEIGGDAIVFAGLGTPTRMVDPFSRAVRPTTLNDMVRHIQLINACDQLFGSQMDVWPNDIPMTTIHAEAICAWAAHSRKSFGMGCYGYLPTLDMMKMMEIVAGSKEALRAQPRFMAICSVFSPLQMAQVQAEGLLLCAEYGQPLAISPEGIAGATSPVTLAGLLVQENANILAHIVLAQLYRPGTPVLYGTVSTIANMRHGTVALGSVETGLITAASAQLARYYGLPCRSVGGATESKAEDVQAGIERTYTLMAAVQAGVNYITCAGTLDSTMMESEALLLLDDDLAGALLRFKRGIEVTGSTLSVDLIRQLGVKANYLAEDQTVRNYRKEHYLPRLMSREPYEAWLEKGGLNALDLAAQRAEALLAKHQPLALDPAIAAALESYRAMVAGRTLEEFYGAELPENQNWSLER